LLFTDQTGRKIILPSTPQRIISLVPSQTELLAYLGLSRQVAGITKFCIHPSEWFHSKTRIGGTKQLKMELIHQLKPDLIIANKEENVKEQVEELANHYPTWISDVNNLEDAYGMIDSVGKMTGKEKEAALLINDIRQAFGLLSPSSKKLRIAYLIWRNPYMTIGGDTFIHSMLKAAGFENMYGHTTRYPEVTIDELKNAGCERLFLSSEPFPFNQKHIDELQPLLPDTKIVLVDGEMFSWYGSRLLLAPEYFLRLLEHG
jgi:ABC-type Fe3+-hydroxamate transport system substrate-binding protein